MAATSKDASPSKRSTQSDSAVGPSVEASTKAPSSSQSNSSEHSVRSNSRFNRDKEKIAWNDLKFGSQIKPLVRHAHTVGDVYLLDAFLELSEVQDLDGGSVKLVLLAIKFLRNCSYSAVDICSILAHASAYFVDVYALCRDVMSPSEVGNVLVTAMFLAHSYIQDETCPLHVWHRYLFKGYCSLKKISEAVMRVMAIRRYVLRLADQDLRARNKRLCDATSSPLVEQVS